MKKSEPKSSDSTMPTSTVAAIVTTTSDSKIMTKSMTGYGRARVERDGVLLEIEIRSWNSRYLDLVFKLPRLYADFEFELRSVLADHLSRGKVEVSVTRRLSEEAAPAVQVHRDRIVLLDELYRSMCAELGIAGEAQRADLLKSLLLSREVVDFSDSITDSTLERELLLEGLGAALTSLKEMRALEGARLGADILARLRTLVGIEQAIRERVGTSAERMRARLEERLARLPRDIEIDPSRLAAEVAMIAERADTSEELTRLTIHLGEFEKLLGRASSEGKKGDFLSQELLREVNTITSKAQDATIQHLVVDAKAEIERIREQIQNIE